MGGVSGLGCPAKSVASATAFGFQQRPGGSGAAGRSARMRSLIVTVTANPAIDQIFITDRLAFDDRSYLRERAEAPGGRGINASRMLHRLGAKTLAIAPCGGPTGKRFEAYLKDLGFAFELVRIRNPIRTNRAVTDTHGLTVKLDEPGPLLEREEVKRLEDAVLRRLPEAKWLLLCGSLPPGVPEDFYARLIRKASEAGVRTLLDADGTPLIEGLEARPSVSAPNQMEAERLLNRSLILRGHFHEAAEQIREMGAETVILSLGSRGGVLASEDVVAEVVPPRVEALCPIGAGDALNAAFVWAVTNGSNVLEAARWGVAAGTASAKVPGLEFADLDQIREVYAEVEVRPVG